MRFLLPPLALALFWTPGSRSLQARACSSDRVEVRGGNLFLISPLEPTVQLTATGRDTQPDLSCDATIVAFIRDTRVLNPNGTFEGDTRREVRILDLRSHHDQLLVHAGSHSTDKTPDSLDATLTSPSLSIDARYVFFEQMAASASALF